MFLTVLSLILGYLTLSISTALLYSTWMSTVGVVGGEAHIVTSQFMAIAGICGLGFATLSGYIVGLVARRAPVAHAVAFSLMLTIIWIASTLLGGHTEPWLISILNIVIALIGAMAGGWIRYAQMQATGNKDRAVEREPIET